ncbi:MAG: hypothetical protein ABJC90_04035 [Roseobacter sp.]
MARSLESIFPPRGRIGRKITNAFNSVEHGTPRGPHVELYRESLSPIAIEVSFASIVAELSLVGGAAVAGSLYDYGFSDRILNTFLPCKLRTPLCNVDYRAMTTKVGRSATINSKNTCDPSLIELHDGSFIGAGAKLMRNSSSQETLVLARLVIIEENAAVGTDSTPLCPPPRVTRKSNKRPGSYVAPGTQIPPNEVWAGVPAAKSGGRMYCPSSRVCGQLEFGPGMIANCSASRSEGAGTPFKPGRCLGPDTGRSELASPAHSG